MKYYRVVEKKGHFESPNVHGSYEDAFLELYTDMIKELENGYRPSKQIVIEVETEIEHDLDGCFVSEKTTKLRVDNLDWSKDITIVKENGYTVKEGETVIAVEKNAASAVADFLTLIRK